MSQCCPGERYVRNLFARSVCAFGVTRAQAEAPQFVMWARFGEAALVSVHEGQAHFLVLGEIRQVASEDYMFEFLLPGIVIEVAYMTVQAFCSKGSSVASIAESAKLSPNRRAFEAITNFSAQWYSTRSTVNGEGAHWEKGEEGSQNKTISSLIYVSGAS